MEYKDIPRLALEGKGSFIWDTLKRGAPLIKEGLFWICNEGSNVLFGRTLGMVILPFFVAILTSSLCVNFFQLLDGLR